MLQKIANSCKKVIIFTTYSIFPLEQSDLKNAVKIDEMGNSNYLINSTVMLILLAYSLHERMQDALFHFDG